ncbi:MAG: hypothetical protein KAT68_11125 [Bacteroidales bacterium]|nr:hypothetical protein [Bacteroidales bacterium]
MKHFCILIFTGLFVLSNFVYAQEQLKHEKKQYIDKNGKLFVQRELPVYLRVSTSAEDTSEKFLLKSETTKEYANPMYFDANGYNTIRTFGEVDKKTKQTITPLKDIVFEVYGDSKPPESYLIYSKSPYLRKEGKSYFKKNSKINLLSYDAVAGVDKIYYSVGSQAFKEYIDPIELTEPKEYFLKFYAVDNVGNIENMHTRTIIVQSELNNK